MSDIYRFLGNFHGKFFLQILRLLDNSAKISYRKNYCETLDSRNLTTRTADDTALPKMYGVQLSVMNR